jgi:hypothetical protein
MRHSSVLVAGLARLIRCIVWSVRLFSVVRPFVFTLCTCSLFRLIPLFARCGLPLGFLCRFRLFRSRQRLLALAVEIGFHVGRKLVIVV